MTVPSTSRRAGPFTGTGILTSYPFTFKVFEKADVQVTIADTNGLETVLVTDSTVLVTLNIDQDATPGGSVQYAVGGVATALPSGYMLAITGEGLVFDQPLELPQGGNFDPGSLENALDRLEMQIQLIDEAVNRTLQVAVTTPTSFEVTLPAPVPLTLLGWAADGLSLVNYAPDVDSAAGLQTRLANPSNPLDGDAMLGVLKRWTGAVGTTQHEVNNRDLCLFDFMTPAQISSWIVGDLVQDMTVPLQKLIDACSSDTYGAVQAGRIPTGKGRITASLVISKLYIHLYGDSYWGSVINFDGLAAPAITTASMAYLQPVLRDFAIDGNASSGKAIDLQNISNQVYSGEFRNLYLEGGETSIYAPRVFSTEFDHCYFASHNGHGCTIAFGVGTSMRGCYATFAGSGKAGYRCKGTIVMYSCNGVNTADFWGVFGQRAAGSDGFQDDFSGLGNDQPSITLIGCNMEHWSSVTTGGAAIKVTNNYRSFRIIGGKFDRNALATNYQAIIWTFSGSNGGTQPVRIDLDNLFPGTGVAALAPWYSEGAAHFVDEANLLTQFLSPLNTYTNNGSTVYPLLLPNVFANDVTRGSCFQMNALTARRLTVQVMRYRELAVASGAAANQTINVTGFEKVVITASGAYSLDAATFTTTVGADLDGGRNGRLIIETGNNANVTINHNVATTGGFRMSGGANLNLAAGRVVEFIWSNNYQSGVGGWIQVG